MSIAELLSYQKANDDVAVIYQGKSFSYKAIYESASIVKDILSLQFRRIRETWKKQYA